MVMNMTAYRQIRQEEGLFRNIIFIRTETQKPAKPPPNTDVASV